MLNKYNQLILLGLFADYLLGAPIGREGPIVKLNSLRVGLGLFTLADPLCDDQIQADDHPRIAGFIPDNTQDRFGILGNTASLGELSLSSFTGSTAGAAIGAHIIYETL